MRTAFFLSAAAACAAAATFSIHPASAASTPSEVQVLASPATYTVVPGDTLSGIAASRGIQWEYLAQINLLADANLIFPGQVLTLPATVTAPVSVAAPVTPAPVARPAQASSATRSTSRFETCVIQRESTGNPNARNGSHWGLYQMTPSLYAAGGGTNYGSASAAEQEQVFNRIVANGINGGAHNWTPWDHCTP